MIRSLIVRRSSALVCLALMAMTVTLGMQCPPDENAPLNPPVLQGNKAPRIQITAVTTPGGDLTAEQGQLITIDFTASDSEDRAICRVFASESGNPTPAEEISILSSFPVGPGEGKGRAFWRTNTVVPGSYFIFAEVDDRTLNSNDNTGNAPVRVAYTSPVLIVPEGIGIENAAPILTIDLPSTDAGLSNGDTLSVRYNVSDANSDTDTISIRILFDRDRSTSNDDAEPPLEVATASIAAGTVPPGVIAVQQQDILIDLNVLPIRLETDEGRRPLPYFVRVQIDDGQGHIVDRYAGGAVRLLRAASDVIDLINVGSTIAGATWQGFDGNPVNPAGGSRAGSSFASIGDIDGDGLADFVIGAETASPFNRPGVGEAYLIYGRERRIPSDFAEILGYGSGRYAGVLSLNTVGSYIPFPSNDPRFERFFNVRGTIIPQEANAGPTSGLQSIAALPDVTGDGLPEIMIGVPRTNRVFDQEDTDPCDGCTFEEDRFAPFDCLFAPQLRAGATAITGDVDGVDVVQGLQWAPVDPVGLNPLFGPNVVIDDLADNRILTLNSFSVVVSGERSDGQAGQFTIEILLENENGPRKTLTVTPDAEGTFANVTQFFDVANVALPLAEGAGVPPSVYDGEFLVFVRPSVGVDFDTVEVRIGATVLSQVRSHPIRLTYFDGFPGAASGNPSCGALQIPPIDPIAMADFTPVCPPRNRTVNPLTQTGPLGIPGFGNLDGHQCTEAQVTAAIGGGGGGNGLVNDDLNSLGYETGLVFVNASDDLVMRLAQNPYGFHLRDGYRVALQRFFGQPPYIRQGGLGMRGARFRGAWYQPNEIYDPLSRFGHTIDTLPDIDTFTIGVATTEILISAPDGGTLQNFGPIDLTANLGGTYDRNAGNPNTRLFASADFDLGVELTNVISAAVLLTGEAKNIPTFRVGLNDGTGRPLTNVGANNRSRDMLLWNGAGFPPDDDSLPTIEYGETYGETVNFSVRAELPRSVLSQLLNGAGSIAVELVSDTDCAVVPTSVRIDSASLVLTGLVKTGYVVMLNGDDYTCSQCTGLEGGRCTNPDPDADPEGGENRPMSWPSYGCDEPSQSRVPCFHGNVGVLLGEASEDSFGFARHAGDLNLDGVADIACGAPGSGNDPFSPDLFCGAEPNPLTRNGKAYIIYGTPTLGSGRPCDIPERFEVRGTHNDDQFGRLQGNAGDMNGDGFSDVFIGAEGYDAFASDVGSLGNFGSDVGFVGVLFGRSYGNATRSIRAEQIGTPNFPGVKFIGGVQGARLGGGNKSADADASIFSPGQRGQYGVSSAGDYNGDGLEDLLIAAPGQPWPAAKIEFEGPVTDGEFVSINGLQFEFDLNGSVSTGRIAVKITSTDALAAQRALLNAMNILPAETLGVSSLQSQNQFPAPLPDTPTINFVRRTYTPFSGWVTSSAPSGGSTSIKTTESIRQGVTYLVFGDRSLLNNKTFVLPDDLNRRNNQGLRVLKGIVFVSGYERNSGVNDPTPDEAPVTTVAGLGDIDGDGFIDIILGAPEADFINIIAPNERRQASGEAYLIYGNNFGLNLPTTP